MALRRALGQLARQHAEAGAEGVQQVAALSVPARQMSSSAHPETPLTKVMPPLVALPRQVLKTALGLTGKLISGAATSGQAKGAVASFAEGVLLKEQFVKLSELDVAYWSYWLSTCGYSAKPGFKRLAEAAVAKVPGMEPQQVADMVVGFHKAGCYDKLLFDAVSAHVANHFTRYETEQLVQMLGAFSDFGHYSKQLFDDVGDSIAYANNYLAPMRVPADQVCAALAAYAKQGHERADVFVTLARGISELSLGKLSPEARRTAVSAALYAFQKFKFYPEQVDALLYVTATQANIFTADDLLLSTTVKHAAEEQAGAKLDVYSPNPDEDAEHWYAHHAHAEPAHHELYVFRDALVPKAYAPSAFRKAPASSTV